MRGARDNGSNGNRKMHNVLVSIVIPCYNQARFLRDAVNSALAQSYESLEVIVVNDGSTDNIAEQMAPYQNDARVKFFSQENRGLGAARNYGIQNAGGEFLKFLDADDSLTPNAIAKQRALFDARAAQDPQLGFVYCDINHVDAQGKEFSSYSVANMRRVLDGDLFPSLLIGGYFPPMTVLIAKRVLEHVGGFNETMPGTADWELWLRVTAEGWTGAFLPERLANYRSHDANMSSDRARMAAQERDALVAIVTRYPQRTAEAIHALHQEHMRVDRDSEWARQTLEQQKQEIQAMQRALNTRGVRAVRMLERWFRR